MAEGGSDEHHSLLNRPEQHQVQFTDTRDARNNFLQVPEPTFKVRFQTSPEPERRAGRRRSLSMPTGLNLLLQFAESTCQPKPGDEKDYFDEVEEQQIYRSNSNTAADPRRNQRPHSSRYYDTPMKSESDADDEIDDTENMSTTGDELSEIESPSADPPPPYPGNRNGHHNQNRKPRFQMSQKNSEGEDDDGSLADEFSKNPLATRRKSGGVLPLKILNSNHTKSNGPPSPPVSGGSITEVIRGKFNTISQTIPPKFRFRKRTPDEYKIQIFVAILFLIIILLIGSIYVIHQEKELQKAYFHRIRFSSKDRKFRLSNLKGREVLAGMLGSSLTSKDKAWPCLKIHQRESESCLEWMDKARLYFRVISTSAKDQTSSLNPTLDNSPESEEGDIPQPPQCYGVLWESLSPDFIPMDCFYINEKRGFYFYGGGEQEMNHWPLNRTVVPLTSFITGAKLDQRNYAQSENRRINFQWGSSLKRQFFGSPGVSVEIWEDVPLYISINSIENPGMMCFAAKHDSFAYPVTTSTGPVNLILNYTLCAGRNVQDVTSLLQYASTRENLEETRHEDVIYTKKLIKTPIWHIMPTIFRNTTTTSSSNAGSISNDWIVSTSVKSNSSIFEKQLLDHADRIKSESLSEDNIILIDDIFEKNIGDFEFDLERFPTIVQTLNYTQRRGFQIAFTVQPYFSTESINFIDGLQKDLWVKEKSAAAVNNTNIKKVPALVQYKNSFTSVLLDITKSKARSWFEEKVKSIVRKYSINALYIGSATELPQYYEFHQNLDNPDDYNHLLIKSVRKSAGLINTIGVSSATKSPRLPTFISLSPIESSWEGLQSIIPNLLTLSITGFSFIMTGPIGGSFKRTSQLSNNPVLGSSSAGSPQGTFEANKPDRNLYIRWMELTYFLPIIQFAYLPSDYDSEVLNLARSLKALRDEKVYTIIKKGIDESLRQGRSVVEPLWMIDPNDINCLTVSDQFVVGGQVIIAPVLKFNSTERDIYLPKGRWRDELRGTTSKGEKWLHRYQVKENEIAFFSKMTDTFS